MLYVTVAALAFSPQSRKSELWDKEQTEQSGLVWRGNSSTVSSHDLLLVPEAGYPADFTWGNKDGVNYLTPSLNQHIPQYCGSCWAHGSVSALGDRIKIAREAKGTDIQLSVQHVLNCGGVGSCHGGTLEGPYQWLHKLSQAGSGISYATSNPYMACSSESKEGSCQAGDWTCTAPNVARTCGTFGEACVGLSHYPNATIAEYGTISGHESMQKEIFARGPIACTIDAAPIEKYQGGIATGFSLMTDHVISVVGWGTDAKEGLYWLVRNSWGEYWGEMGYIRVEKGNNALQLETQCSWAVPDKFTDGMLDQSDNFRCYEDGTNCGSKSNGTATRRRRIFLAGKEDA